VTAPPPPPPALDEHTPAQPIRGLPEPGGTEAFYLALLRLLDSRPLTPLELERAIDRAWPRFLRGRRGYVHPALLHLRRRGAVVSRWVFTPRGARRAYVASGAPDETAAPPEFESGAPLPTALAAAAAKMARGLAYAPVLESEVRQDVEHHLVDAVAALQDAGRSETEAVQEVLRDFGDAWRIRTDLRRIAQGRRTVLIPRNLKETLQGMAIYDAGILLCIVGAIVFVRLQVFTAYHIPTRSMEPTLHGDRRDGDRILVNRLASSPDRFDITVFDGWGSERKNYVKRCVGLPNETLRLREGDVYIDGELVRKTGAAYEALLFPLYGWDDLWRRAKESHPDDSAAAHEEVFDEQFELWENVSGKWMLDTGKGYHADAPRDGEQATLRWRDTIHDDIYDPETGDVEGGTYTCPDLRLTADVVLDAPESEVALHLTRGAAAYDAVLSEGRIELRVEGEPVVTMTEANVPVGKPVRVRFAQVDRVLRLDVDDVEMVHELPQPEYPKRSAPHAQVDFRVRGGAAWVKPLALERDVFYTPDYDDDEIVLGPDDFFMLGDNSGNSQDSRRNGAVHRGRLVGEPILIVWPPKRWRIPR
jgi:signal peptidase I